MSTSDGAINNTGFRFDEHGATINFTLGPDDEQVIRLLTGMPYGPLVENESQMMDHLRGLHA